MNTTKKSLFTSLVACFVLLSMLMGTTFAWFTDIVSSENNVIQSGSLKAEMYWSDKLLAADSDEWIDASAGAVFNHDNWEPGYTQVRYVKVVNNGSLKFKWQLSIAANGKVTELSDAIDVYYVNPVSAEITSLDGLTSVGTLTDVLDGNTAEAGNLDPKDYQILAIAFHMDEYAGNEYQDMSLCEAGFSLKLIATQATGEFDSFDDQYDADAEWPYVAINYSVGESVENKVDNTSGTPILTESVTVGEATDDIYAEVPAGVQLADGVTNVTLSVNSMEAPTHQLDLERGEVGQSVDVHIEGVAPGNTVPIKVSLDKLFSPGLNPGNAKMFHIENGTPVAMTRVEALSELDAHNEFYYDVATGDVVMSVATFSEYEVVEDNYNYWNGGFDTSWYVDESSPYTIYTPAQLAAFGAMVDGGGEYSNPDGTKVNIPADDFKGKVVQLGANIDLRSIDASGNRISFNPIGFGYDYAGYNTDDKEGHVFRGTFDGQGHTISNLYVNGWDIGISYSNSGGGLFASVCDATIKNLTMRNADIVMECVEQGVIAGLAQGSCTFDNINIYGCSVANYQRSTGGVVGEVSPKYNADKTPDTTNNQTHNFTNIHIDSDTVIGSLWGDFDAPVGGVIGAKWDDGKGITKVHMENVIVDCRLDVYNDVTSSYQWYAYRRAGMLIGNTEDATTTDGHTVASADFLTCKNVTVHYGTWTNYHYCEFSDYNPSWPYVRAEVGENCSAFSNPRWGVPEYNGEKVTPENHPITEQKTHNNGDDCMVLLTFNQLYGGGQGVYGNPAHNGVTVAEQKYEYTITYINNGEILHIEYVPDNTSAFNTKIDAATDALTNQGISVGLVLSHWMNAGSSKIETIPAGNRSNFTLYPSFVGVYTATFVDQNGNILAWDTFTKNDYNNIITLGKDTIPPEVKDCAFDHWEVHVKKDDGKTTATALSEYKFGDDRDVTVYPVYLFKGDVNLIPVDDDNDGIINYYQVGGYSNANGQAMVEIPASVNGIPIVEINEKAFSSYDGVHSIVVPNGVTINKNAFTSGNSFGSGEQITIYYEGTKSDWLNNTNVNKLNGWDYGIGTGSRVFFLKDGKVNTEEGYLEVVGKGGVFGWGTTYSWSEKTDFASVKNTYTGTCNCGNETTGDTGHVYKDAKGDTMKHNAAGTPMNSSGDKELYVVESGIFTKTYTVTDGTDTYYRYRPDAIYWEGI